jgi:hypothetical protein
MIKLTTTKALDTGALLVVLNFTDPLGNPVSAPETKGLPEWLCYDPNIKLTPQFNASMCGVTAPAGVISATIIARVTIYATGKTMEGSMLVEFGQTAGPAEPNPKPSIGRIIHVILPHGTQPETVKRPGIIVRTWPGATPTDVASYVNAQVFTDESNDSLPGMVWKSSLSYDETAQRENSWHWPAK